MSEETTQVPDEIGYDSRDVKRAASRPQLRLTGTNEYMEFVVRSPATKSVNKKSSYQLAMECSPLNADGEAKMPTIRNNLQVPIRNKSVPGHEAPNTAGLCHGYLLATGCEGITRMAKWSADDRGWVKPDGEILKDKRLAEAFNAGVTERVIAEMVKRWKDPSLFERDKFFAQVKEDRQGEKVYRNLTNITGTLPGDATLIRDGFAEFADDSED